MKNNLILTLFAIIGIGCTEKTDLKPIFAKINYNWQPTTKPDSVVQSIDFTKYDFGNHTFIGNSIGGKATITTPKNESYLLWYDYSKNEEITFTFVSSIQIGGLVPAETSNQIFKKFDFRNKWKVSFSNNVMILTKNGQILEFVR